MTVEKLRSILWEIPSDYKDFDIYLEENFTEQTISEVVIYPANKKIVLR